jgi:S-adenosylmethionine decarboxylase
MNYQPGTHLIATIHTPSIPLIQSYESFQTFVNKQIEDCELQKLGEVYHNFSPQGFTGVVCLSESHLSIHTWPEWGKINLDIYLSNHLRTNNGTVIKLYAAICGFFEASVENEQILKR